MCAGADGRLYAERARGCAAAPRSRRTRRAGRRAAPREMDAASRGCGGWAPTPRARSTRSARRCSSASTRPASSSGRASAPFDVPAVGGENPRRARARAAAGARSTSCNARAHPSIADLEPRQRGRVQRRRGGPAPRGPRRRGSSSARPRAAGRRRRVGHAPARRRAGPLYAGLDAVGATNYEGWYATSTAPGPSSAPDRRVGWRACTRCSPSKVLVITEFGAEANARNPPDAPGGVRLPGAPARPPHRAPTRPIRASTACSCGAAGLRAAPELPRRLGPLAAPDIVLQRGINAKGLFTYGGRPKPAAEVVKRLSAADRQGTISSALRRFSFSPTNASWLAPLAVPEGRSRCWRPSRRSAPARRRRCPRARP